MGRIYTVPYTGTPAAAVVPWVLTAASGRRMRLLGFNLESETSETDQQMSFTITTLTGHTPGTGGTTPTPSPTDTDDPPADFTTRINGSAPSGGTRVVVARLAQPIRNAAYADPPVTVLAGQAIEIAVGETAGGACVGTAVVEEL